MQKFAHRSSISRFGIGCVGAAFVAAGCGGGGQVAGTNSGPGGGQSANIGPISVTYSGKPQSIIQGGNSQVSVIGESGASYSSLAYIPTPNLASTYLLFTRNSSGSQIYTMPALGGTPTPLVHASDDAFARESTNGQIVFLAQESGKYVIEGIRPDGTGKHVIVSSATDEIVPTISPNGATIAYLDLTNKNIYTVPFAGGTVHTLYNGGDAGGGLPIWSPNGATIAFTTLGASNTATTWTIPAAGGTPTKVSGAYPGAFVAAWSWSPDSETIACAYNANSGTPSYNGILLLNLTGGFSGVLTPSAYQDTTPAISPDGKLIAFYRDNTGGATPGIYMEDFGGTNPELILPDPGNTGQTGSVADICWSPFPAREQFAGSGGTLTTGSISGFLLAQTGSQFGSLVTFAATTPSTATITSSPTSGGAIMYLLGGDSITNVSFANVYFGTHTSTTLTSTPSVAVSIDGTTGAVDFVAPALAGHPKPAMSHSGGPNTTMQGSFSAIYDAKGTNLAPNGASTIVADSKTGKLISFR